MKFQKILCAIFTLFAFSPAFAGPFGFDVDAPPTDLSYCKTITEEFLYCSDAPKPHPDMLAYAVTHKSNIGVCAIAALSKPISDNGTGVYSIQAMEKLAGQIASKYGRWSIKKDELMRGSLWNEPQYWIMGLIKKERQLVYRWEFEDEYKHGISRIQLSIDAEDRNTTKITASFLTKNLSECEKSDAAAEADSF